MPIALSEVQESQITKRILLCQLHFKTSKHLPAFLSMTEKLNKQRKGPEMSLFCMTKMSNLLLVTSSSLWHHYQVMVYHEISGAQQVNAIPLIHT